MDHADKLNSQALIYCPVHGYIPFTIPHPDNKDEITEQQIIDHPWVQRMRQIHQLQTAWWVFPGAEHSRFQHIIGVMHLASRAVDALYDSLHAVVHDCPSRGFVETLLRLAALLHDVGHGPFGHFFDKHYLQKYNLNHESLGAYIIVNEMGDLLKRVRRNPYSELEIHETISPDDIAFLIKKPSQDDSNAPTWLRFLRALFSGIYTIDNMDFVLRDAYMVGISPKIFDLDRLLYYTSFSAKGLTIHERGIPALVQFLSARANLFRTVYFHRSVRGLDLSLEELFRKSGSFFLPGDGNPIHHLDDYRRLTDWSLLVMTANMWPNDSNPEKAGLGLQWNALSNRKTFWRLACEHSEFYTQGVRENASIFASRDIFKAFFLQLLPEEFKSMPLKFDVARHVFRPDANEFAAGINFVQDASGTIKKLDSYDLYRALPLSARICRIYLPAPYDNKNPELVPMLQRIFRHVLDEPNQPDSTNL